MHWLVESALANALSAAILAVVVLAVSRRVRNSALTHALWVLVLVKLVTPPIVEVPIPVEVAATQSSVPEMAVPEELPVVSGTQTTPLPVAQAAPGPRVFEPSLVEPAEVVSNAGPVLSEEPATASAEPVADSIQQGSAAADWRAWFDWSAALRLLLALWAFGSVVVASLLAVRFARFVRLLRSVGPADPEMQQDVRDLAISVGLRRSPPVVLVPWTCSPMLWGCGRAARLLFPAALWDELDDDAREALLLHELAHYRRGDHWVRLLELAATILYWWHPVVWFGRRQIAIAEEECCDAWAVERFTDRPRVYADALLATLDFVAEHRPALPPAACGIGELPVLRRRLTQIMRRSVERSLGTGGRWCLTVLATVALPLHPVLALLPVSSADASLTTLATPDLLDDPGGIALPSSMPLDEQPDAAVHPLSANSDTTQSAAPAAPSGWWDARPSQRWAAAAAPGGRFRLVAEVGHRVRLQGLDDSRQFDLGQAKLTTAAFLPDGRQFVAGALDGSVRVWDAASGEAASLLGWHDAEIRAVAISADGRWAVSGSADGSVFVWEIASGRIAHAWSEPGRPIVSVAFSPDGSRIAIAAGGWQDSSSEITLLETNDWKEIQRLAAPSLAVVEFAPDGSLFSADWSGRLLRWEPTAAQAEPWGIVDKELVSAATFSSGNSILGRPQF